MGKLSLTIVCGLAALLARSAFAADTPGAADCWTDADLRKLAGENVLRVIATRSTWRMPSA